MKTRYVFLSAFVLAVIAGSGQAFGYSFTTLDPPGSTFAAANGISGGTVVGTYHAATGVEHGFIYNGSAYTNLDFPGATWTEVDGISGATIVGTYNGSSGGNRGFIYNGSTFTTLDRPNAPVGNGRGTFIGGVSGDSVVGWTGTATSGDGFIYDGSTFTTLDFPGADSTRIWGISGGNIVGDFDGQGFICDGSTFTTLVFPPGFTTQPYDISGNSVVGYYSDQLGKSHGFIAQVPEPGGLVLGGLGLLGLISQWRRRVQTRLVKEPSSSKLHLPSGITCRRAVAFAGLLIVTFVSTPAHAQWSAGNLNPSYEEVERSVARGGAGTQVVGQAFISDATRYGDYAVLWSLSPAGGYSFIDLNPAGATSSDAFGTTGTQQVGQATFGSATHAGLWNGTAASWVDLNPAGAASSSIASFTGTLETGSAKFGNATHAGRWNGTAASWIDLNPSGASGSVANAIAGTQEVGSATFGNATHAGLWNNTASSWIDLNPTGATSSVAKFITSGAPGRQVGSATFGSSTHAGLWNGTAASWVDLNPIGATSSQVNGLSGTQQVGQAMIGSAAHAGLWNGTSASWVDLNPAGATTSVAYAISGTTQVGYASFSDGTTSPGVWSGTAASWQRLPLPDYPEEGGGWYIWAGAASSSIWTDGNYLYVAGYVTRWHYVSSVQDPNAILWWSPISSPLLGDFNGDHVVDAKDYITWRKGLGTTYSQTDFSVWRSLFGQTAGSGAALPSTESLSAAVPEPATLILMILAAVGWSLPRRRAA